MKILTLKTPVVVVNLSQSKPMINEYRFKAGRVECKFHETLLSGQDVFSFLQKQSTFNIQKIIPGTFHLVSFLDPQGRIEFYCWCLNDNENYTLLLPKLLSDVGRERLEKYLVSEDVNLHERGLTNWSFCLGPESRGHGLNGHFLEEKAVLLRSGSSVDPMIPPEVFEKWRLLNGWPDLTGQEMKSEIINNSRLYDLSVSENKGCYPGQETVSKIATRRGAAFAPVLIEVETPKKSGEFFSHERKIGECQDSVEWEGKNYLPARIIRDFRIQGSKVTFELAGEITSGTIKYFPLLSGDAAEKAKELFYGGSELFAIDKLSEAEARFRMAISLDPTFSDAYEALGVMLGRQERFSEAIEVMKLLEKVDPSSVMAHTNMSLYLMRLGKIEEAEEQKSLATLKSFQKFGEEARQKDIIAKQEQEKEAQLSKSESMYLEVLELDDEDSLANYGLGAIAVDRKQWQKAIIHLEKVIKTDPGYSVAYLALGKALKGAGDIEKAKLVWKEGISVAAKKGDLMPANQMQSELQLI